MDFVDVILPLPLEGTFTYSVPAHLNEKIQVGKRVWVPLGKSKNYVAVAVRLHNRQPDFSTKPIKEVLDETPILLDNQLAMWEWMAHYYMSSLGDVMNAALPAGLKSTDLYHARTETYVTLGKQYRTERQLHRALDMLHRATQQKKLFTLYLQMSRWDETEGNTPPENIVEISREELLNESGASTATLRALLERQMLQCYEVEVGRLNHGGSPRPEQIKPLTAQQQKAAEQINALHKEKDVVLLHGVTSSGKTEVYIHLIEQQIRQKKQVLFLVPEIALTVQMMERLRRVFGNRLGIYHSRYSDAERVEIWQKQLSDEPYDVILGARSAVFLPFQRLGLVIVDEEHEGSFKQQDPAPRYHARSAAIVMAQAAKAKVLLGTATPSAETYYNATIAGKYGIVEMHTRYQGIELPHIQIVDVKDLRRRKLMTGPLSPPLIKAMGEALNSHQQVILFQNRRGFAPLLECKTCGWVPRCRNCDVPLTYHKRMNLLTCHYCGYAYPLPDHCPSCEEKQLQGKGIGTERLEDTVKELFPSAKIARMDLDTTRSKNAYERIIGDFSAARTNILIGTQMVTKGLDFDHVSVVGIIDADGMLSYPDFRAYEHAFNMMAQVSGRAGRKGQRGTVFLQTRNAQQPVIQQVCTNNYSMFYEQLFNERNLFHYPPYSRLIYIYLKHGKEQTVERAASQLATMLRHVFGTRVLGPDKPSVGRIKQQSIRKLVLKLEKDLPRHEVRARLKQVEQQLMLDKSLAALHMYYDVDPE